MATPALVIDDQVVVSGRVPSEDEVRAIKFQSSRFNSMTDSHESTRSVWTDTFGGCSGIFYTRK